MPWNDLAGVDTYTGATPQQMLAGDEPLKSDSKPALADITKFQLIAIRATGVTPWVHGTDTAENAAIAAQTAASGKQCPYWYAGKFNWQFITDQGGFGTPNAAIDTYAEANAYFTGLLRFGKLAAAF